MSSGEEAPAWAADLPSPDGGGRADRPAWADHLDEVAPAAAHPKATAEIPHAAAPTQFHKAATTVDEPELSLGETLTGAAHNLIPSAKGAGEAIAHSIMHPIKTAESVADLGKGAVSQAAGAFGVKQDPAQKAKTEALISALEDHYKTAYGSVKGFKKNLALDPVGVAMDAATFIDGAGAVGKIAGLEKTAAALSKTASVIDPIANAVRLAKVPLSGISIAKRKIIPGTGDVARLASSITTGVPASAMKLATKVGADSNPAVRAAYSRFVRGQGDATEFQQAARGAVNSVKKDMSDAYLAQKGSMAQNAVDFTNSRKALADAYTKASMGATTGPVPKATMDALDQARDMVDSVANDPARSTLEHADALKQQLWDLKDHHKEVADTYLNGIYHGVRDDLIASDPAYAALMEKYQIGLQNVNDLTKTLVGGKNAAATATLMKNLKALKTGSGENLLSQIMDRDPTIGAMLSGAALHPWHKRGVSLGEAALGAGAYLHDPASAVLTIPAAIAASSPRLAGTINHSAGVLDRLSKGAARSPIAKGAYYAGRAGEEGDQPSPISASDDDIDLATRMVLAEAGNQPDMGKAAVIHTALNRSRLSGRPLGDIISDKNAFEGVTNGNAAKIDTETPEYRHAREIVERALKGEDDPTKGVTYFLNKDLQKKLGRKIPSWAAGDGQQIGDHTFYALPFGRAGRKSGGRTALSHDQLVERLMKLARQAKKGEIEKTEPLLRVPDETVARALEVAQRAI